MFSSDSGAVRTVVLGLMISGFACAQDAPDEAVAAKASLPKGAVRLEPTVIVDETGFEQPMAAATLFVPHGWKAQGGVHWGQQFACTNGYVFHWSATAPDGLTSIAVLPQERWEWNNYGAPASTPGCHIVACRRVQDYLGALVPRLEASARILGFRPREDLRQQFAQLEQATPMPLGESRTWVEAGEVSVAFRRNDQEMRGSVAAVAVFSLMRTNAGTGIMDALSGSTFPAWAVAAPKAQFNPGLFEAIRRSIKLDPRWEARINQHNNAIAQVAIRESRKRSEMITRANEEIAKIRQDAWNAYQESSDRRFREFGEVLRGVETYRDPDAATGQVELSNLYSHAWRLNDGSYVLTNDVGFEPFRDLGVEGKQLEIQR
jgi:hypothetical protein